MAITEKRPAIILLAEDDLADQILTKKALESGKIKNELYIVNDGEEALDYLLRRENYTDPNDSPTPDLFLLDLNMPKINGKQVLHEMQKHPDLRNIVVIVLTTSEDDRDVIETYDLGGKSFITKPVSIDKFIKTLHSLEHYWFEIVILPSETE